MWETFEISVKKKIWDIRPTRSFTACHITGCISCWNIPGKGDKPTFGYDKTKFPDYVCLEGADNDRALVMCRVPWIDEDVTLEGEEDWMYNGEKQMSLVFGDTNKIA